WLRGGRVGVGLAVARVDEEQAAGGVVRGRGPHEPAAGRGARRIAAGTGRQEARRQPELALAVVAVVAPDVVSRRRSARGAAVQVEEPDQPSVHGVDGVETALAEDTVVDVHPEEDLAVRHQRRRLDLVAFALEATESWRIDAAGSGVEVPVLGAG